MRVNALSTAALALASAALVSGQTKSKCDPRKKDCPPDPAFGKNSVDCDMTKGKCDALKEFDGTSLEYDDSKGAVFSIAKEGNAPTVETNKYIFFGRVDVELQVAPGGGVITSVVLESDDLEEIDLEWVGSKDNEVQSNYFPRGGDNGVYDRGGTHPVSNAASTFHTYSVEWTPDAIDWIIDGTSVRTLKATDAGEKFPQTPMRVKLGSWAPTEKGGSAPGAIEWAGGPADFSKGPFNAYYKSLKIVDYAGGSKPTDKSVKEYVYGDKTGDMKSIQVKLGDGSSDSGDDDDDNKSTSSKKDDSKTSSAADSSSTKAPSSSTGGAKTTMSTATSQEASESSSGASKTSAASSSGASQTPATTDAPGAAPRQAIALGSAIFGAAAVAAFLF